MSPDRRFRCIMVVDDDRDSADSLAILLRMQGYLVGVAHDALAALEIAQKIEPTLVILDIGMPDLDGYETCRRMRRQPWGALACIVALTGWGQPGDRMKSREAGFDLHLVKPVDPLVIQVLLAEGPWAAALCVAMPGGAEPFVDGT